LRALERAGSFRGHAERDAEPSRRFDECRRAVGRGRQEKEEPAYFFAAEK
jgi:hypothetical protein